MPTQVEANATGPFDVGNPAVQSRVTAFQTHLRGFFDGALSRGAKYLPSMRDILVREGLPAELAYLPLIESGYRTQAVSPAGAAGPWQFIPETGRRYGLRIDALVDERRDPIRSTVAASQYLKDLHEMFGDWELSLAAYNSGEYRVARILANKDVDDYWDMRDRGYLPSETSAYVPKFLAAVQIARAPEDYGFESPVHHTPEHYEEVDVDRQVSLRAAADICGVSATELAELNPALRSGVTPERLLAPRPRRQSRAAPRRPRDLRRAGARTPQRGAKLTRRTRRTQHRARRTQHRGRPGQEERGARRSDGTARLPSRQGNGPIGPRRRRPDSRSQAEHGQAHRREVARREEVRVQGERRQGEKVDRKAPRLVRGVFNPQRSFFGRRGVSLLRRPATPRSDPAAALGVFPTRGRS